MNVIDLHLPITAHRQQIIDTVAANAITIVEAETGAGKSTQVAKYLLEEGYKEIVTQPRRLAARTVAERVADEIGEAIGHRVGYRTAQERKDSAETRCLFCTDGFALVRELFSGVDNEEEKKVLIIDEVHEWNLNIEILLGWARHQIEGGAKFRLVVMSATLQTEKLSQFLGGAPIISVPGRLFPVEQQAPGSAMRVTAPSGEVVDLSPVAADAYRLAQAGRNVLVFQPGKAEINATIDALRATGIDAEILPLHGDVDPIDQRKCFAHYARPKIVVATNVAQTSVTIDDIDAVVDSGMERRIEVVDGVEGLYLRPISLADSKQRAGRAGRCKAGIYIDHCPTGERLDYPVAEILRSRLDMTVLRLEEAGIDLEELRLFHQPLLEAIREAKRSLVALGCMDATNKVTKIGKQVARLPLSANIGRMIIEASRLGVVDDVIVIAALMEEGGIVDRGSEWRKLCKGEEDSDLLAQLTVFKAAAKLNGKEFRENGVFAKSYFRVKEIIRHVKKSLPNTVLFGSTGRREDILKAVCAGMVDHLYRNNGYGELVNGDSRQLGRESVVELRYNDQFLVGKPFDLEIKTKRGGRITLNLVVLASKVKPEWLAEVAPQLYREEKGLKPCFDAESDSVKSTTKRHFNGQEVGEVVVEDPCHAEAAGLFTNWLASQMV